MQPQRKPCMGQGYDTRARAQEHVVRADEVIPPMEGLGRAAAAALADRPFVPITVAGDRQFFVSLRYGRVLDRPRMLRLLTGAGVEAGESAGLDVRLPAAPAAPAGGGRARCDGTSEGR